MKRWLIGFCVLALLFAACNGDPDPNVDPDNPDPGPGNGNETPVMFITLNHSAATILKLSADPATLQLTRNVLPAGAIQEVNWTSNNETVATVDENGLVTGLTEGEATITATTVGKLANGNSATANCVITVVTTDPALFRWSADDDPEFDDIAEDTWRDWNGVSILAMGQDLIAHTDENGRKGYYLNWSTSTLNGFERDPDTGWHVDGGDHIRGPNSRLIIGSQDFGYFEEFLDDDGDPVLDENGDPVMVRRGLSSRTIAPLGELDLFQPLRIIIEFSGMTSGVGGAGNVPESNMGWQIFVLNNTTSMNYSVMNGGTSRIRSDQPASAPEGGYGTVTQLFNGSAATAASEFDNFNNEFQAAMENGFISIHSGYGRQLIIHSIVIEPNT